MTGKIWALPELNQIQVKNLARQLNVSKAIASVYLVRGLHTPDIIEEFCNHDEIQLHNPLLLPDMEQAIDRICYAMRNNERILVISDSDTDGITSCALLVYSLFNFGFDVMYHVPDRITEGFGIHVSHIDLANSHNAKLIISADTGTDAFDACDYARTLGIDFIITDHHLPNNDGILPDATAVINPKRLNSTYPFQDLAGVGVAYKLIMGLAERLGCDLESIANQILEFVAIGTIADMVCLDGENKRLVHEGCETLTNTTKVGMKALLRIANIKQANSNNIGFFLAPMINATGRMLLPNLAVELLLEQKPKNALLLARQVHELNNQRKVLQAELTDEILGSLSENNDNPIIFASGENWHRGLLGLVSNNLLSKYGKPSYVSSILPDGTVRGSCRTRNSYNLSGIRKIHEQNSGCLISLGGHEQAYGFVLQVENLSAFHELLNENFAELNADEENLLEIDTRLPFNEINFDTFQSISKLAPFGNGNLEPLFLSEGLVIDRTIMLSDGKHLKFILSNPLGHKAIEGIYWQNGDKAGEFQPGVEVDAVYKIGVNEFAGRRQIQLTIEDLKIAG